MTETENKKMDLEDIIGVTEFKITYGINPPSITISFPRVGTTDGEKFIFYNRALAIKFANEITVAYYNAFGLKA